MKVFEGIAKLHFCCLPSLRSMWSSLGPADGEDSTQLGCSGPRTPLILHLICAGSLQTFSIPQAVWNNDHQDHKAPTPAPVNPSTKPPSADHILPVEVDKTQLEATFTQSSRFRKKHTCWHIFPHRMCLKFIFYVPDVIFHDTVNKCWSRNRNRGGKQLGKTRLFDRVQEI